jgi:hypothetical protein
MSEPLDMLRARVDRAELEARLLSAMVRIRTAERALARFRVKNERAIGIYREHEYAAASEVAADAPPMT